MRRRPTPVLLLIVVILALLVGAPAAVWYRSERAQPSPPAHNVPTDSPQTATPVVSVTLRTFYIAPSGDDAGPGSESRPWRTLGHAAATMGAGDTAIVADGVYREGSVGFANSGTATRRITLKAQHRWGAKLVSDEPCIPALSIEGSYVTVQGLHVTRAARCEIYSSADTAARCWTGHSGCQLLDLRVEGNFWVGIKANQDYSLLAGIHINGDLETFNAREAVIRDNTIYLEHGDGITTKGGGRSNQVYNNTIVVVGAADRGLVLGGNSTIYAADCCNFDNAGPEGYRHVAWNNVVVASGGTVGGALVLAGCRDCAFLNNAVVGLAGAQLMAGGVRGGAGNPGYAPPVERGIFRNNIFACTGQRFAPWGWDHAGKLDFDHNLVHRCPGAPSQAHRVTGDPRFVEPTSDWRLRDGSAALGAGAPVLFVGFYGETIDVGHDRGGRPRTAPWDIGPYDR